MPPFANLISILAIALGILGCSTVFKTGEHLDEPSPAAIPQTPLMLQTGLRQLEEGDALGALSSFDGFLESHPMSPYTQIAILNSGRALESLGRYAEARDRYRSVIGNTAKAPKLRAMALYRLSFCQEALEEGPSVVATLLDARERSESLPLEVATAELPARLAAAYARVGSIEEAMRYYSLAEAGVACLRSHGKDAALPEWLPQVLYQMGRMSLRRVTWDDFQASLKPIAKAQIYLLQAVELGAAVWSQKATEELQRTYDEVLRVVIAGAPSASKDDDPIVHAREMQERQWVYAELVLNSLRELRAARPLDPATASTRQVAAVFDYVEAVEKQLRLLLDRSPIGSGLTAEAIARRQKLAPRVISPDASLERRFEEEKRRKGLPEKGSQTPEPAAPSQTPLPKNPEDPNL